jgi:hypothetical protein
MCVCVCVLLSNWLALQHIHNTRLAELDDVHDKPRKLGTIELYKSVLAVLPEDYTRKYSVKTGYENVVAGEVSARRRFRICSRGEI